MLSNNIKNKPWIEFHRSPRDYLNFPTIEVEIKPPPTIPTKPTTSLSSVLLPLVGAIFSVVVMIIASQLMGSGAFPIYIFISLPMMVISVIGGVSKLKKGGEKYAAAISHRNKSYLEYLQKKESQLILLKNEQIEANLIPNPSPEICLARVLEKNSRLWERSLTDPDFLIVRLGTGKKKTTFAIKPPPDQAIDALPDELYDKAINLVLKYKNLDNYAINFSLPKSPPLGIICNPILGAEFARGFLTQVATHHPPNDVKIIIVAPEEYSNEWAWARWLPHVWSKSRDIRFIGTNSKDVNKILTNLENTLVERKLKNDSSNKLSLLGASTTHSPAYVVFFADANIWAGSESQKYGSLFDLILNHGNDLGVYPLFFSEQSSYLPAKCKSIITQKDDFWKLSTTFTDFTGNDTSSISKQAKFTPDFPGIEKSDLLSRSMATLRMPASSKSIDIPETVPFLSLWNVSSVDELPLIDNWLTNSPIESMQVPVGVAAGGKPFYLDIQDNKDGPNGLIAGTVGAGKGELMSSFVLSLAINFHPDDVNFVFLDFKDGDFCRPFANLPHVVNTITNEHIKDVPRALKSLIAELSRRAKIFNSYRASHNISNLMEFNDLYTQGKVKEKIPFLVIICDEFPQIKTDLPTEFSVFEKIARTGRSPGFRMIMACQNPTGVITPQIKRNTQLRMCLKVTDGGASKEVIGIPDASQFPGRGRTGVAIKSVSSGYGKRNVFQSGWAGAPYYQERLDVENTNLIINSLDLVGNRIKLTNIGNSENSSAGKQITAIVNHIQAVANENNIRKQNPIWHDVLPKQINLTNISDCSGGWDGERNWKQTPKKYNPIIGMYDAPTIQEQDLLRIDFEKSGQEHLAVFGSSGSGKTMLLQTLITSLVYNHSPEELNIYVIDFASQGLNIFSRLPHIGAVILKDEIERLQRLIRYLREQITARMNIVSQSGTMASYRKYNNDAPPDIFIILNNYSSYTSTFINQLQNNELKILLDISNQGSDLGIHLIIATGQPKAFESKLLSNFSKKIVLRLNDSNDYLLLGKEFKDNNLTQTSSVGRGIINSSPPFEIQIAFPGKGKINDEDLAPIRKLVDKMSAGWQGNIAKQITKYPKTLSLSDLLPPDNKWKATGLSIPIGINLSTIDLLPFSIKPNNGPHFWIAGQAKTGKTTFLQTWLLALAEKFSPNIVRFYLFDSGEGLSQLDTLPHVINCIKNFNHLKTLNIEEDIQRVSKNVIAGDQEGKVTTIIAIDNYNYFRKNIANTENEKYITGLVENKQSNIHIIAAGTPGDFISSANPIASAIKNGGSGFLLGQINQTTLIQGGFIGLQIPKEHAKKMATIGAGFRVKETNLTPLHLATWESNEHDMQYWLNHIKNKFETEINNQ